MGGATGSLLAAGDVVAGAVPGPRGEVGGGGKSGHVDADLGDDALGGSFADAGDRVEPVTGLAERGDHPVDFDVEGGDRPFQIVDVVEDDAQHDGVVVIESAGRNAWRSSGILLRSLPLASSARASGSR